MISISFETDIAKAARKLKDIHAKQIPFAASRALNELAFDTREYLKKKMDTAYEGGAVRFTKNAIYSSKTTKRELMTRVYVGGNGSADHQRRIQYVISTLDGGKVVPYRQSGKPFAPNKSKIRVTTVGHNMPFGFVKRNLNKPGYFIHKAGDKGKMPPGLYQRVGKGKRMKIKLLVAFYDQQTNKPSFKGRELAKAFAERHFNKVMGKAIAYAIATAK